MDPKEPQLSASGKRIASPERHEHRMGEKIKSPSKTRGAGRSEGAYKCADKNCDFIMDLEAPFDYHDGK
jgi:hypothetical protein